MVLIYFLHISGFFFLKSGLNCVSIFLFDSEFDSERASGFMFNVRPPVKMIDFHGEQMIKKIPS
jgi:hypothetical protein